MEDLLDYERPDLVLMGGDTLWDNAPSLPKPKPRSWALEYWAIFTQPLVARGIPWAVVLGNHDYGISDLTSYELLQLDASYNGSLTVPTHLDTGYYIDVLPHAGSAENDTVLSRIWMMHSGQQGFSAYHLTWYNQLSASLNKRDVMRRLKKSQVDVATVDLNAPPAIVVMHIAPPEMLNIYNAGTYWGHMRDGDGVCCQKTGGAGVFEALQENGNVRLMMFGHDHGNDFAGQFGDTFYTYALKTGIGSYPGPRRGARIFEMATTKEGSDPSHTGMTLFRSSFNASELDPFTGFYYPVNMTLSMATHLRLADGSVVNPEDEAVNYPPFAQLTGCCEKPPLPIVLIAVCSVLGLALIVAIPVSIVLWRTCPQSSRGGNTTLASDGTHEDGGLLDGRASTSSSGSDSARITRDDEVAHELQVIRGEAPDSTREGT